LRELSLLSLSGETLLVFCPSSELLDTSCIARFVVGQLCLQSLNPFAEVPDHCATMNRIGGICSKRRRSFKGWSAAAVNNSNLGGIRMND